MKKEKRVKQGMKKGEGTEGIKKRESEGGNQERKE